MGTHMTADGYAVCVGDWYWDNGLHLTQVKEVACHQETNMNPSSVAYGEVTYWHDTTTGLLDGSRLAKTHPMTGENAGVKVQANLDKIADAIGRDLLT